MPETPNAVRRVIDAAGGRQKLADRWAVTYQAIFQFEKAGWLPLAKARTAVDEFPDAATLRELVRKDIAEAMDLNTQASLLD